MKRRWTTEEDEYIAENWQTKTDFEMGVHLGRTPEATKKRRSLLRLSKNKYKQTTLETVGQKMGRQIASEFYKEEAIQNTMRGAIPKIPSLIPGQAVSYFVDLGKYNRCIRTGRIVGKNKNFVMVEIEGLKGNYRECVQLVDFVTGEAKIIE